MSPTPQPDTPAIDLTLPDAHRAPVQLSDFRGKNVVLAFYPGDWTPVCASELTLMQETLEEIHAHNAEIVGISTDSSASHRAWAEHEHLTFPLLSDFWPHGEAARRYGVFDDRAGVCGRALFFIDAEGTLREAWVAEDPAIAPGLDVVFDALGRIQGTARRSPELQLEGEELRHV
jgi:peroxiredoxin